MHYTGDLFIVVKTNIEPVKLLDQLITEDWCTNVLQSL